MSTPKRRWITASLAAGALALAGVGGVAAITLPASATMSVSTPSPQMTGPDATENGSDGEAVDDQVGEVPGQDTADDPGHEDGTADGETADDAPPG